MTVMNEGLPLNSNYIKFGFNKEGFQDPLSSFHSHLLKLFAMRFNHIYGFASLRRAYIATRITFSRRVTPIIPQLRTWVLPMRNDRLSHSDNCYRGFHIWKRHDRRHFLAAIFFF